MLFNWLRDLLAHDAKPSAPAPRAQSAPATGLSADPPRYPPADAGLQVLDAAAILAANADLIDRLKLHAASSDEQFEERFVGPLLRVADHIGVIPATAAGLFSGNMGLFRAALESAFYSFQASDGRIFTGGEGVERRHALEGRWRYLCFLAGLHFPLGKTLERVAVTDAAGRVWKRHFGGITDWTRSVGAERLFVSWGTAAGDDVVAPSKASLALLPIVVGGTNLQYLQDGSGDLVSSLYEIAAGDAGSSRIAHQVVVGCWGRIERREAARRPQVFGRVTVGTQLGPYLVGAIRELVGSGTWKVNATVLKADRDGLYMVWPAAAADLIAVGVRHGYAGWPADAPTLAALLQSCNVVEDRGFDLGLVEVVDDAGEILTALKFVNPLAVLEDYDPDTYAKAPAKSLDGVLADDPLAGAEAAALERDPARVAAAREQLAAALPERAAAPAVVPPPSDDEGGDDDDAASSSEPEAVETVVSEALFAPEAAASGREAPPPAAERGRATQQPRPARGDQQAVAEGAPKGRLKEAPDVRYSDLVPEDIRAQLRNPRIAEQLGKVVKAWRDRGENSAVMRRIDTGAAIEFSYLTKLVFPVPPWVDAMSAAGLIYVPPGVKGDRIGQKVAIPESGPQVRVVVLSNLACKRLGL